MKAAAAAFANATRMETAQKLARLLQRPFKKQGSIKNLPGILSGWTAFRDLKPIPKQSFREWWAEREAKKNDERSARRPNDDRA